MDESSPVRDGMRKLCGGLRAATWSLMRIAILSLVGSLLLLPFGPLVMPIVSVLFIGACFLAIGMTLLRVLVVALFFARVSMWQMLLFSLVVGALLTLTTALPPGFNGAAFFTAMGLVVYVGYTITLQDPTGENVTPAFMSDAVASAKGTAARAKEE